MTSISTRLPTPARKERILDDTKITRCASAKLLKDVRRRGAHLRSKLRTTDQMRFAELTGISLPEATLALRVLRELECNTQKWSADKHSEDAVNFHSDLKKLLDHLHVKET